jgi:hypothetical protein
MPPEYFERPILHEDLRDTVEMFFDLSGSRPVNFGGPGAIPASEMNAYFEILDITDPDIKQVFLRRFRVLDSAFLQYHSEKRKKTDGKKAPPKAGGAPKPKGFRRHRR